MSTHTHVWMTLPLTQGKFSPIYIQLQEAGGLPCLLPPIGYYSQTDVNKRLQFDSLEIRKEKSLSENDFGFTVLVLDHTLQSMCNHLLQIATLHKTEGDTYNDTLQHIFLKERSVLIRIMIYVFTSIGLQLHIHSKIGNML